MFREVRKRAKKAGQPPGTLIYTGKQKTVEPAIRVIVYDERDFREKVSNKADDSLPEESEPGYKWVHVEGLHNVDLINQIAKHYQLHPLTVEDILNVGQRSKVEEFDHYLFITIKMIFWHEKKHNFSTEQLSIVIGKNYVLSFQETQLDIFKQINDRLRSSSTQRLRQQGSDYLMYRMVDIVVDQYFVVLEGLGELIEKVEDVIITDPTPQNARTIYSLKRKMLMLRKAVWPMREAISHLLQVDHGLIAAFTRVYIRDVYDHIVQAIDTIETFRDMLASMLDIYLSSLTNRMNQIMKVLTIIATIFIPITFIASFYGMNFPDMPELHSDWGYPVVVTVMFAVAVGMLLYFRRNKWL